MCQKSAPAAAMIPSASSHRGHGVRKTNWPLWKRLAGYLNKSSNMGGGLRTSRDECVDAPGLVESYKHSHHANRTKLGAYTAKRSSAVRKAGAPRGPVPMLCDGSEPLRALGRSQVILFTR